MNQLKNFTKLNKTLAKIKTSVQQQQKCNLLISTEQRNANAKHSTNAKTTVSLTC